MKEENISFLFKKIVILQEKIFNKTLETYGITFIQFKLLEYIKHSELVKVCQRDLEKKFQLSNPTITGFMNRLEDKGLIHRSGSVEDRRVKYVELTKQGEELLKEVEPLFHLKTKVVIEGFSDEEIVVLRAFIKRIKNNLEEEEQCLNGLLDK